jgi:hypothetical protein
VSSPKAIANSYDKYLEIMAKETNRVSGLTKAKPDLSELKALYQSEKAFLPAKATGVEGKFTKLTEDLLKKTDPTYADVIKYKMEVDRLGGGYESLEKAGKPLMSQLLKSIRGESRSIAAADPVLDSILNSHSIALKLKDTILKNPEIAWGPYAGVGGIGTQVNVRPAIDALRPTGLGGRLANSKLGKAVELGAKTSQRFAGPLGVAGSQSVLSEGEGVQEGMEPASSGGGGSMAELIDPTTGFLRMPSGGSDIGSGSYTIQDGLQEAMSIFPGASEAQLLSLAKALVSEKGSKVDATTQGKINEARAGLDLLGSLKGQYGKVQGANLTASGPGLGRLGGVRGTVASATQSSPEAAAYQNTVEAFMSRLSRASGERGVLTDQDIKRIRKAIPGFYDTSETAAQQWALVEDIIGSAISRHQGSGRESQYLDF